MAPGFRQKGHVVTHTLIPVGSADIEDPETTSLAPGRIREVGPGQYDLGAWNLQGPVLRALHHEYACHRALGLGFQDQEVRVVGENAQEDGGDEAVHLHRVVGEVNPLGSPEGVLHQDLLPFPIWVPGKGTLR